MKSFHLNRIANPRSSRLFSGSLALLFTFAALGHARASGDWTEPVGSMRWNLSPGFNAVSVALVNPSVFTGQVRPAGGSQGNVFTFSDGNAKVGLLISPGLPYYLEVTDRTTNVAVQAGERFEVDVDATLALGDNRVVLLAGSPTNTLPTIPSLNACVCVIRPHVTLGQIFGQQGSVKLGGSGSSTNSDQVWFLDPGSGSFRVYWFRANVALTVAEWIDLQGSGSDDSDRPILPGEGVFVYRHPSRGAVDIVHQGNLRTTPFRLPLRAGYQLVSHGAPADQSPAQAKMRRSLGWNDADGAGSGASLADRILLWNGQGFTTYWLRSNSSGTQEQWLNAATGDTTNFIDSSLLAGDRAFVIMKVADQPDYQVTPLEP